MIHFIHQAYDKYSLFEKVKQSNIVETYVIDPSDYYYPKDFSDYNSLVEDDSYQLQLFSQVAKYVNIKTTIHTPSDFSKIDKKENSSASTNLLKKTIKDLLNFIFRHSLQKKTIIVGPYFKDSPVLYQLKLFIKAKFRITFDTFQYNSKERLNYSIDHDLRNSIKPKSGHFKDWILPFVIKNIPIQYFEHYPQNMKIVKNLYNNQSYKFFTYNDLYHNTMFQYFLANSYKKHFIMSAQHGCAYGMDKRHEGEEFEKSISQKFFTYGWSESSQTKPLPMPKIKVVRKPSDKYSKILLVTTTRPRYVTRFCNTTISSKMLVDHVENPIKFLDKINYKEQIRIRHHLIHDKRKWYNKQRIKAVYPELLEDQNQSFYKSLKSCKILISDHFGTTFLESMQMNIPSFIFINKSSHLFRDSFKSYLEGLVKHRILHFNPIHAADHLNANYNNIDSWWQSDPLQKFRRRFVQSHSNTSENWMDIWCDELIK